MSEHPQNGAPKVPEGAPKVIVTFDPNTHATIVHWENVKHPGFTMGMLQIAIKTVEKFMADEEMKARAGMMQQMAMDQRLAAQIMKPGIVHGS